MCHSQTSHEDQHHVRANCSNTVPEIRMAENKPAFEDPRVDAKAYLESKGVLRLFQELGTALIYNKPEDPRAFIIEELKRLKEKEKVQQLGSSIFTETDVETMFGMFDPTGTGFITKDQCKQAFSSLCLQAPSEVNDSVSKDEFCKMVADSRAL